MDNKGSVNVIVIAMFVVLITACTLGCFMSFNKTSAVSYYYIERENQMELLTKGITLINTYHPCDYCKDDFKKVRNGNAKVRGTKVTNSEYYYECIIKTQPYKKIKFHLYQTGSGSSIRYAILGYEIMEEEGEY